MFPVKSPTDRSAPVDQLQHKPLRAALRHMTLNMRRLEEQLPLPADRLVRDTSAAKQKATALRVDIEELNVRLTHFSRQFQVLNRIKE